MRDDLECVGTPAVGARARAGRAYACGVDAQRRVQTVLAERRTKSQEFFVVGGGPVGSVRGRSVRRSRAPRRRCAFADAEWTVGDRGCGTGQMTAALAPFVARSSRWMRQLRCFRRRRSGVQGFENVELRRGDLEALAD